MRQQTVAIVFSIQQGQADEILSDIYKQQERHSPHAYNTYKTYIFIRSRSLRFVIYYHLDFRQMKGEEEERA